MSTNDPTQQYLTEIGRRVVEEQLAAQQQSKPVMDTATAQANRNQQILYARHRREQERERQAALEREASFKKQKEKEREQAQEEQAEFLDTQLRVQVISEWAMSGLSMAALDDKTLHDLLVQKRLTHMEEYEKKQRSTSPANGAI